MTLVCFKLLYFAIFGYDTNVIDRIDQMNEMIVVFDDHFMIDSRQVLELFFRLIVIEFDTFHRFA